MMNTQNKKKIALVLSGGGIKAAAYHIGVCMAMREKGFHFLGGSKEQVSLQRAALTKTDKKIELYVGSSAGSFIGATLASGRSLESLISAFRVGFGLEKSIANKSDQMKPLGYRHVFNLNTKRMLSFIPESLLQKSILSGGLEVLLKKGFKLNGIFNTRGVERYLRTYVLQQNDFDQLGVELFVVATQLNHSRKSIFGHFNESSKNESHKFVNYAKISEAVAASTALPPVFAPYPIIRPDGKEIYHYDGEIRDTLSTHVAIDHKADLVIASYSMQPYHYVPEIGSLHKYGMPTIVNQALYQVLEQKVARHRAYQSQSKDVYLALKKICEEENLSLKQKNLILQTIKSTLKIEPKTDTLYISPRPQDYEMFFADHFSLNEKILDNIIRIGFKSALTSLDNLS